MSSFGKLFGAMGGGGSDLLMIVVYILLGTIGMCLAGLFAWWMIAKRKKWNLDVEFRLPRDINQTEDKDGNIRVNGTIIKEWGKGYYNAKKGVVFVKRKGKPAVAMKPFNIKEFLSGKRNILTVIQVGIEDYRPILEQSYLEVMDNEPIKDEKGEVKLDESGEPMYQTGALIHAKIDTSESRSWKNSFERESKATYTIMGFLSQHGQLFGFGFILISIFVGFAIMYGRIT